MALHFPHSLPPAAGELIEVVPGVFWLRMPLPFQLDHINLWLLPFGCQEFGAVGRVARFRQRSDPQCARCVRTGRVSESWE